MVGNDHCRSSTPGLLRIDRKSIPGSSADIRSLILRLIVFLEYSEGNNRLL